MKMEPDVLSNNDHSSVESVNLINTLTLALKTIAVIVKIELALQKSSKKGSRDQFKQSRVSHVT